MVMLRCRVECQVMKTFFGERLPEKKVAVQIFISLTILWALAPREDPPEAPWEPLVDPPSTAMAMIQPLNSTLKVTVQISVEVDAFLCARVKRLHTALDPYSLLLHNCLDPLE